MVSVMKRIYMDNSATTAVDPLVLDSMLPYFNEKFGNASSLHSFGQEAAEALSVARRQVADSIGAKFDEIIFTSGGTESDNLAIRGVLAKKKGENGKNQHIITSVIEHPAVLSTCTFLESIGYDVTYVPVDSEGVLDVGELERSIRNDTSIISVMHANNEIGTIQPIEEISSIAQDNDIYFHTDAVQTVGKIPVDVNELGVDMLSISSHKIHGPKGVGVLYVREGTELEPLIFGGGHEKGVRPGTENIPGIVGLGKAASLAKERLGNDSTLMRKLRDSLIRKVFDSIEDVRLNGHPELRLPNNVNLSFRYAEGESLQMLLDIKGIAISTASACSTRSKKDSHVLSSIGLDTDYIHGTIRISLGKDNTMEETDYVAQSLKDSVGKLREMSAISKS